MGIKPNTVLLKGCGAAAQTQIPCHPERSACNHPQIPLVGPLPLRSDCERSPASVVSACWGGRGCACCNRAESPECRRACPEFAEGHDATIAPDGAVAERRRNPGLVRANQPPWSRRDRRDSAGASAPRLRSMSNQGGLCRTNFRLADDPFGIGRGAIRYFGSYSASDRTGRSSGRRVIMIVSCGPGPRRNS